MPTYKQFKKFLRDKCWNERDYGEGIYDKLIYDFLVEEVKENKEPQFTPGQMVEVSNDGEKWYKYIFSRIVSDKYICCVDTYHGQYECSYRFARPIEEMNSIMQAKIDDNEKIWGDAKKTKNPAEYVERYWLLKDIEKEKALAIHSITL